MDIPRVSKAVRRITVLREDSAGHTTPVTVFRRGRSYKKGTRAFQLLERAMRQFTDAEATMSASYLSRHTRSNQKKRDGWIRDFPINTLRATQKGLRAIKLSRLLFP